MNKYQEALDYINGEAIQEITNSYFRKHKTLDGISFEEFDKNLTKIQELVDKATPKKVKRIDEVFNGRVDFHQEFCGNCGAELFEFEELKYCQDCGQALDWSEDEPTK